MKIVERLADRLLAVVVPRTVAAAAICTGLEQECWCETYGGRRRWGCAYCQYCPDRRCGAWKPEPFSC